LKRNAVDLVDAEHVGADKAAATLQKAAPRRRILRLHVTSSTARARAKKAVRKAKKLLMGYTKKAQGFGTSPPRARITTRPVKAVATSEAAALKAKRGASRRCRRAAAKTAIPAATVENL